MFHQCLHTLGGYGSDEQTHVEVHYERAGGRLLRTRTPAISVLLLVCLHGPDTSEWQLIQGLITGQSAEHRWLLT